MLCSITVQYIKQSHLCKPKFQTTVTIPRPTPPPRAKQQLNGREEGHTDRSTETASDKMNQTGKQYRTYRQSHRLLQRDRHCQTDEMRHKQRRTEIERQTASDRATQHQIDRKRQTDRDGQTYSIMQANKYTSVFQCSWRHAGSLLHRLYSGMPTTGGSKRKLQLIRF